MRLFKDIIRIVLFAVPTVILVHYFILQPFVVPDDSMAPDIQEGDVLLINRLTFFKGTFARKDVVVFRDEEDYSKKNIRRIVGLPFERIVVSDGIATLHQASGSRIQELPLFGSTVTAIRDQGDLDEHEYFVLADAMQEPPIGMIDGRFIVGRPFLRIYPLNKIGRISIN